MLSLWPTGGKIKIEAAQDIAIDDDLSALLGAIPAAAMPSAGPPEWPTGGDGEASNGQSSAVTDGALDMQHVASSLSTAGDENHSWAVGHRR